MEINIKYFTPYFLYLFAELLCTQGKNNIRANEEVKCVTIFLFLVTESRAGVGIGGCVKKRGNTKEHKETLGVHSLDRGGGLIVVSYIKTSSQSFVHFKLYTIIYCTLIIHYILSKRIRKRQWTFREGKSQCGL